MWTLNPARSPSREQRRTDDSVLGCGSGDSVDADWPSATLPVPASASFPDCVHLKSICILFTAHFPSSDHGRLFLSLQPSVTVRWERGGERCVWSPPVHAALPFVTLRRLPKGLLGVVDQLTRTEVSTRRLAVNCFYTRSPFPFRSFQ